VENRVQAHCREAVVAEADSPKAEWIRELIRSDLVPTYVVLEKGITESADWEEREQHWIRRFAGPDLLNATPGGKGVREMSEETRRKISRTLTGKTRTAESIRKQKETQQRIGYKHTPEALAKLTQARRERAARTGYVPVTEEVKQKLSASISSLVWITDGVTNRRIPATFEIPKGWTRGRFSLRN
jgi:hypothetical protein